MLTFKPNQLRNKRKIRNRVENCPSQDDMSAHSETMFHSSQKPQQQLI